MINYLAKIRPYFSKDQPRAWITAVSIAVSMFVSMFVVKHYFELGIGAQLAVYFVLLPVLFGGLHVSANFLEKRRKRDRHQMRG